MSLFQPTSISFDMSLSGLRVLILLGCGLVVLFLLHFEARLYET